MVPVGDVTRPAECEGERPRSGRLSQRRGPAVPRARFHLMELNYITPEVRRSSSGRGYQ